MAKDPQYIYSGASITKRMKNRIKDISTRRKGYNQKVFSQELITLLKEIDYDISESTISNWFAENRTQIPSASLIPYIAEVLDCTINYLYGVDEYPYTNDCESVADYLDMECDAIEILKEMKEHDKLLLYMLIDSPLFTKIGKSINSYLDEAMLVEYEKKHPEKVIEEYSLDTNALAKDHRDYILNTRIENQEIRLLGIREKMIESFRTFVDETLKRIMPYNLEKYEKLIEELDSGESVNKRIVPRIGKKKDNVTDKEG